MKIKSSAILYGSRKHSVKTHLSRKRYFQSLWRNVGFVKVTKKKKKIQFWRKSFSNRSIPFWGPLPPSPENQRPGLIRRVSGWHSADSAEKNTPNEYPPGLGECFSLLLFLNVFFLHGFASSDSLSAMQRRDKRLVAGNDRPNRLAASIDPTSAPFRRFTLRFFPLSAA